MRQSLNLKKNKFKRPTNQTKKPESKPTIFTRIERLLLYKDPLKILLQGKWVKYSVTITMLDWKTSTIKSSTEYFWNCKRLENIPAGKHSLSFHVCMLLYLHTFQKTKTSEFTEVIRYYLKLFPITLTLTFIALSQPQWLAEWGL